MVATTSREIGTLVAVVLKAKNLPNKRHIGKQDPYCSVTFNGEKKRTKAIKRGGQHPEWDEEFRYTLYEDPNDIPVPPPHEDGTPPPPPPKKNKGPPSVKGGRLMLVACYAEDPREPDFIGEANVDLTEVLTKGETDEWFTLTNKEKYCGEVYLELTFWSNEPEPVKKAAPKTNGKNHKQYGGPGQFVPAGESPSHDGIDVQDTIRSIPTGGSRGELRPDHVPPSLRPSTSRVDLYVPPYETSRSRHSMVDSVTSDFAELNTDRRISFPPQQSGYAPRPASSIGFQDQRAVSPQPNHGYHPITYSDSGGSFYEGGATPPIAGTYQQGILPEQYQPPYETLQPAMTGYQAVPRHGPRRSMPPTSSGFVPMPTPAPSGFVPLSSHHSQPSGFAPLPTATPAPQTYGGPASHMVVPSSSYSRLPQPPIASSGFVASGPSPTPVPYHHSSLPYPPQPQSPGTYHPPYVHPPSNAPPPPAPAVSVPPGAPPPHTGYVPPPPPPSVPPQSHSAPPEKYTGHHLHQSTSLEHIPPPPPLQDSPPSGQPSGSRPLPLPTQPSQQQNRRRQSSLPIPPAGGPPGMYNPPQRGPSGSFGLPPPPQAGPPVPYNGSAVRAPSGSYTAQNQSGLYMQPTGSSTLSYSQQQTQPVQYHNSGGVNTGDAPASLYSSIPPPPPLPSQTTPTPAPYMPQGPPPVAATSPSLPPPPSQYQHALMPSRSPSLPTPPHGITRRPSLPPPPTVAYTGQPQPQSAYQALPPPPAPPSMPPNAHYEPGPNYMPVSTSQPFHPGPPPRPPAQPNGQPQYPQYPPNPQAPYGGHSPIAERGW
ncbi:hypothetical protein DAEQUDRAFT_591562 [Daedalea quercina L-15889]|uniref:C2 domain-containing protein n=1 Tax=Daedalea quercina L-15889 TaxID=1314783 RepID=A0A165SWD4_9APHY|nr:hypothetical protein DAEQUDRAFT_591562 [Daedalea quercina L-15889]